MIKTSSLRLADLEKVKYNRKPKKYFKILESMAEMKNPFLDKNNEIVLPGSINHGEAKNVLLDLATKSFNAQENIYRKGAPANKIYLIVEGRVKIKVSDKFERTIIKHVFEKGALFGENALLGESKRFDSAVAMEETALYVFNADHFYQKILRDEELKAYLYFHIGNRLIETEKKVESFIFKNARARIIEFLIDLVEKQGQRIGYEMLVRNFFIHKEIASITNTSRQTVTTILNQLRSNKILTFNRRRLLIRDMEMLRNELSLCSNPT